MKNLFSSSNLSRQTRRRVDLAIAVAQERLLSTHVDHALNLVGLVGEEVPFDHGLEIYSRLLRLTEDEGRVVTTRALATLGARARESQAWPEQMPASTDVKKRRNQSLLTNLRQRVRGRINDELRRRTELEAARAEVALFEGHIENALHFVEILEGEVPPAEAVELYLDALDVRDSIAEVAYYFSLARLSEKLLPAGAPQPAVAPAAEALAEEAGEARRLRVVENDGG